MPRYFFDIHNDGLDLHDAEGVNLPDRQAAECEAIGALQDLSRSLTLENGQGDLQANVRDEAGTVIFRTTLALRSERLVDP